MTVRVHRFIGLLFVVGLLASALAVMPSGALAQGSSGGNAEAAKACKDGGYLNYTDVDGNGFKNAGQCTRYAAQGNTLIPVVVSFLQIGFQSSGSTWTANMTGAGLMPGAEVWRIGTWSDGTNRDTVLGTVSPTGDWNYYYGHTSCGLYDSFLIRSTDQTGAVIESTEPLPC